MKDGSIWRRFVNLVYYTSRHIASSTSDFQSIRYASVPVSVNASEAFAKTNCIRHVNSMFDISYRFSQFGIIDRLLIPAPASNNSKAR
jgi:hypothetical protein